MNYKNLKTIQGEYCHLGTKELWFESWFEVGRMVACLCVSLGLFLVVLWKLKHYELKD